MSTVDNWLGMSNQTSKAPYPSVLKPALANSLPVILRASLTFPDSSMSYVEFMCRGMHCEIGKRRGVDVLSYEKFKEADFSVSEKPLDKIVIANFNYQLMLMKGFVAKALDNSKKRVQKNRTAIAEIDLRIAQINAALSKKDVVSVIKSGLITFDTYSINLPPIKRF